jgi:GntR family transcriptional repressor for pyruvate dehydrogenase complex
VRTGSGAYVRHPEKGGRTLNTGHSPTDVLNARMIVEGEAAALAAENAHGRDLEAAADAIRRMIADHDARRPWSAGGPRLSYLRGFTGAATPRWP